MVSVSGYLIGSQAANKLPLPPKGELGWWYQFYFATERGRAGYAAYRRDFAKLIWQIASPHVALRRRHVRSHRGVASTTPITSDIVIHNYRWRLGLAEGEARYDDFEKRLAAGPVITVPDDHHGGRRQRRAASGGSRVRGRSSRAGTTHRLIPGVGHNLPQEAPRAFADAVVDVAGFR